MLTFWLRQLSVWGAAALTISISYRLYRRFRRKYLRDWFMFIVVFNLCLYIVDLLRTVFPGLVADAGQTMAQLAMVFNALLVRPLAVIGLLFFLRFILGLLDIAVRRRWRLLAVIFMIGHAAVLAVLAVRFFAGGGREAYAVLVVVSDWLVICGLYGALAFMLVQTARHETEPRQRAPLPAGDGPAARTGGRIAAQCRGRTLRAGPRQTGDGRPEQRGLRHSRRPRATGGVGRRDGGH